MVTDLSTLRPCLLLLVTVAIPDVWSYDKEKILIDSPVNDKYALAELFAPIPLVDILSEEIEDAEETLIEVVLFTLTIL